MTRKMRLTNVGFPSSSFRERTRFIESELGIFVDEIKENLGGYTYERHRPEESVLYKVVQENLETFLTLVHEECGRPLPDFVEKEFREYLKCGILAYGFLRSRCEGCHNEHLVAFSCKRRGFCPSCGGRCMSERAIHLVDEVLPVKPIRQWVLSFPIQVRLLLAVRPKIMTEILNIATATISRYLCKKAGFKKTQAKTGTVTLIQRFGGSINLNIHFHQLFLNGVYELDEEGKPSSFHAIKAPTQSELTKVLNKIIHRTASHLEKRGLIVKDEEEHLQLFLVLQLEIEAFISQPLMISNCSNSRYAILKM